MKRIPTHPGEILKDELDVRGLSINRFAHYLGVPPGRISQIIQGKRSISPDTALRLGRYFGNSPQFWMNLQVQHDLAIMERDRGEEIIAQVATAR